MSENEFKRLIIELGFDISDKQLELFKKYADFLLEYNKKTNLTAIRNKEDVYLKHFFDSILVLQYIRFSNEKILDIGSGAGFPGIPLKIMCPEIELTLLDSNGKKTTFLNNLKNILDLDYKVVNERAEIYVKENRESYDVVTSRAVTAMPALSELSLPFVKLGGIFLPLKGNIDENYENGLYAIELLGGKLVNSTSYILPLENAKRSILIIKKICKTDSKYPRSYDRINKKPLQK